jgi:two-component system response regulator HydG
LLESELFGHKAGSFTGAIHDRAGLFEQASAGTILLDEIGDVPLSLQVVLLRVLQEKKVRRVGENHLRDIDVRVIAATNRELEQDILDERFREDLFYRLRVVEIHIPPLRERPEDILPFTRYFVERLAKRLKLKRLAVDPACLRLLESYAWPGNVRELENALERAAIMTEDGWIREEHLPPSMLDPTPQIARPIAGQARSLAEMEREYVLAVLKSLDGNRTRAAKTLGIGATTLWRRLKEWGEPELVVLTFLFDEQLVVIRTFAYQFDSTSRTTRILAGHPALMRLRLTAFRTDTVSAGAHASGIVSWQLNPPFRCDAHNLCRDDPAACC